MGISLLGHLVKHYEGRNSETERTFETIGEEFMTNHIALFNRYFQPIPEILPDVRWYRHHFINKPWVSYDAHLKRAGLDYWDESQMSTSWNPPLLDTIRFGQPYLVSKFADQDIRARLPGEWAWSLLLLVRNNWATRALRRCREVHSDSQDDTGFSLNLSNSAAMWFMKSCATTTILNLSGFISIPRAQEVKAVDWLRNEKHPAGAQLSANQPVASQLNDNHFPIRAMY